MSEPNYVPEVDDILVEIWGYDMTIATFYKIVSISATGKSVKIVELEKQLIISENFYCPKALPSDKINPKGKSGTKRVKPSGYLEGFYGRFISLWDGNPVQENHLD